MKNLTRSLFFIICWLTAISVYSQDTICELSCNDLVNISLDSACERTLEPMDVLVEQDTSADCGGYRIAIEYPYGQHQDLAPNRLDGRLRGEKIRYRVIDTLTGNSCWGYIQVEDKHAPALDCSSDTIYCFEPIPPPVADSIDCGLPTDIVILREEWTSLDCAPDSTILGYLERDIRAADKWGNYVECTQRIYLLRVDVDSMECIEEKPFECLNPKLWDTTLVTIDEEGRAIPKPLVENGENVGLVEPPFVVVNMDTVWLWPTNETCNIFVYYEDHVIPTCGASYKIRRFWTVKDWCDSTEQTCIQWIPVIDTTPAEPEYDLSFPLIQTITTNAHDCKAHYEIKRPPIKQECTLKAGIDPDIALSKLKVRYQLNYVDPYSENGAIVYRNGEIPYGKTVIEYLPPTDILSPIEIEYSIIDECWNDTSISQFIIVRDNDPPTPVCDELTQVTLDPDSCWARVYAIDLDDGSHDNCADSLHYAVASMSDIEYWTNRWLDSLAYCHGHDYYYQHQRVIDSVIAEWIDFYVFDDYVDVTDCDKDTLVLRVYEQFNFPPYDPHVFKGSKHYWYNWYRSRFLLTRSFRCNYLLYYEDILKHQKIYPPLGCEYIDDEYIFTRGRNTEIQLFEEALNGTPETAELHGFLAEACYEDDAVKNAKIVSNLNTYPILRTFVHESQALRAFIFGDVFRHLFFNLPYYNDCMIEIIKDDKEPPVCEAPEDFTIYCDSVPYGFEWGIYGFIESANRASDLCPHITPICNYESTYLDGGIEYTNDWERIRCELWLKLDSFDREDKYEPVANFGEVNYYDNCTPEDELELLIEDKGELDECGTGYITRVWTVIDKCGNSSECKQTIHVLPRSDYEVMFPEDLVVDCDQEDIDLSPDGVGGHPFVQDADCELIGITYDDQVFDEDDEACYKILRTWKLVNWCAYNPDSHHDYDVVIDSTIVAGDRRPCTYRYLKDGGDGYMEYLQVIKVKDYVAPKLECETVTICSYDSACSTGIVSGVLAEATDNCTPEDQIAYRYYLIPEGATSTQDYIYGHGNELDGEYAFGIYEVHLIAEDKCHNADTCIFDLRIIDCKKPTPYCYNGIATVIMPSTGEVTVWASDLDAGSYDNCPGELIFSFDSLGEELSKTFTCADIFDGKEQIVTVDIWVFDVIGNKDFCTTYIALQDGEGNACSDTLASVAQVLGSIYTEYNMLMGNVPVWINNGNFQTSTLTVQNGTFMFQGLPKDSGYRIKPLKNDNLMDGVSTLDIIVIQKHLIGLDKFQSPYKMIAGDLNKSNSLTALDIITLRKLILGAETELPNNNTSWRFVDANHVFEDLSYPWGFPEEIGFDLNDGTVHDMNFVAVKVGDVNQTADNSQLNNQAVIRSTNPLVFKLTQQQIQAGDLVEIPVYAEHMQGIEGFQIAMNLSGLEWMETTSDLIHQNDQLWVERGSSNLLGSVSYPGGWDIQDDQPVLSFHFRAIEDGLLSDMIDISEDRLTAEAYNTVGEALRIELSFQDKGVELAQGEGIHVFQNKPNPFNSNTQVSIYSDHDQPINFKVLDVTGRIILEQSQTLSKGMNHLALTSEPFETTGIYYYQIQSGTQIITKKMIKID